MAENKKSFIAYCDWIDTFNELDNEHAGMLIKHLLEYVNDKNPVTENMIVRVGFANIKTTLKRDLKKWENTSTVRSETGKIGGIKSGEARRHKSKQIKANEANALKSKQIEHDNVNDSVNDVDYSSSTLFSLAFFEREITIGQNEFTLHAQRQTNRTLDELENLINVFITECRSLSKLSWPNASDARKHFINWVKKQPIKKNDGLDIYRITGQPLN